MKATHAEWPGTVNVELEALPDGDGQTERTIGRMWELATADATTSFIRGIADQLPFSEREFADGVWWLVRSLVRFRRDIDLAPDIPQRAEVVEVLIRPLDLVDMARSRGDCDDFSMLAGALLLARGVPFSFATVAADPRDPSQYSHVYVVAHLKDGDRALDASHGFYPGWETPNRFGKRKLWGRGGMRVGLGDPTIPLLTTTETAKSDPWWMQLANRGIDFVQGRFGTPENTYYRDAKTGVIISRGSKDQSAIPGGFDLNVGANVDQKSDFLGSIGGVFVYGTLAVMGFFLLLKLMGTFGAKGRRRR